MFTDDQRLALLRSTACFEVHLSIYFTFGRRSTFKVGWTATVDESETANGYHVALEPKQ